MASPVLASDMPDVPCCPPPKPQVLAPHHGVNLSAEHSRGAAEHAEETGALESKAKRPTRLSSCEDNLAERNGVWNPEDYAKPLFDPGPRPWTRKVWEQAFYFCDPDEIDEAAYLVHPDPDPIARFRAQGFGVIDGFFTFRGVIRDDTDPAELVWTVTGLNEVSVCKRNALSEEPEQIERDNHQRSTQGGHSHAAYTS